MKKRLTRLLGLLLLIDGALTFLFGRKFVRLFRIGKATNPFRMLIEKLLVMPPTLLRMGGGAEAVFGLSTLAREPLEVPALYNMLARGYAAIDPTWREWFYRQAHKEFDQTIMSHLPKDGTILDLGCGTGGNLARLLLLDLGFDHYTGVDLTRGMLAQARNRYSHIPRVDFYQLDLLKDPLLGEGYDLIISTWVFEHLSDPLTVVEKAWQRLKTGGYMVLMFEVEGESLKSRIYEKLFPLFSAKPVRTRDIHSFPGLISTQRFTGILADLALVVLEKSENPS